MKSRDVSTLGPAPAVPPSVPPSVSPSVWSRRAWVALHTPLLAAPALRWRDRFAPQTVLNAFPSRISDASGLEPLADDELTAWEQLAQHAVDAAKRAGAQYADARLTRTVIHPVGFVSIDQWTETIGIDVRALVNGYWGFTAAPSGDAAAVERLARDAVAQARSYARGLPRTVDLGTIPPAVGRWTMPIKIDPFTVPFEEKCALLQSWIDDATRVHLLFDTMGSHLHFIRQERVVATTEGACFTQTLYESGGRAGVLVPNESALLFDGFMPAAKGWEMALEADVPAQLLTVTERAAARRAALANPKPAQLGRYTLVCDGVTMAAVLDRTLGIATQLDRAMGYEANASGTTLLSDPLSMLGTFQVASPLVTVMANRSAPTQLATVKWDDEGVEPDTFPLVKDGILVDYQTTRESAAWLTPWYQKQGKRTRSHGCAAAENALYFPLQQPPNLALVPATANVSLQDLVANVTNGILLTQGDVSADYQCRTGLLRGMMHQITNGRVGRPLEGGTIRFNTIDFWKKLTTVGGVATQEAKAVSFYPPYPAAVVRMASMYPVKGEPPQQRSYTVQAAAATITEQPVINLSRKA